MSSFTTPLIGSLEEDGRRLKVFLPFRYHIGSRYSKEIIAVPSGFITDFASIPRLFWSILPPWGRYGKAAVIHDYLYAYGIYNREKADNIFKEAMEVLKVKPWKIKVMYKAVRLFGRFACK